MRAAAASASARQAMVASVGCGGLGASCTGAPPPGFTQGSCCTGFYCNTYLGGLFKSYSDVTLRLAAE